MKKMGFLFGLILLLQLFSVQLQCAEAALFHDLAGLKSSLGNLNRALGGRDEVPSEPAHPGFLSYPKLTLQRPETGWYEKDDSKNLYQIQVAPQSGWWRSFDRGLSGYHALKNALMLLQIVEESKKTSDPAKLRVQDGPARYLSALTDREAFKPFFAFCTTLVGSNRANTKDITWLSAEDIRRLIDSVEYFKKGPQLEKFVSPILDQKLSKLITVAPAGKIEDSTVVDQFKRDRNFVHAFILNNPRVYSGTTDVEHGHWFSLVVNKYDGNAQYIVMDSKNVDRVKPRYDKNLEALINQLEGKLQLEEKKK